MIVTTKSESILDSEIQQRGQEVEEAMVEVGRDRCKRAPCQISMLNGCLCGIVVDSSRISVIECRQPGCETQWVSLYYNMIRKVDHGLQNIQYDLECISLEQVPMKWICEACEALEHVWKHMWK